MARSLLALALVAAPLAAQAPTLPDSTAARIDRAFARFTRETPGCALGVARGGRTVFARGYGMANLETGTPMTPETVSETGSVAKQFTAAAIVLLAQQGRLSLDDDVHKYIPELQDYGAPVTLRQMLHHTSGLRDWIVLLDIAGRPTGTQVASNADVVAMAARQRELNFAPGSRYLYSNMGYTLLSEVVRRVSGRPFAAAVDSLVFRPLGMTHTQWRDDYARVVKGRATAYDPAPGGGFRQDMPFTNVHGSGGLLTTVGDLLRWAENFWTPSPAVGGRALVDTLQTRGRLTSGREIPYALGLVVGSYRGVPEVSHTGSTAGYRTALLRYPAQHVAVALLCNVASANTTALGRAVADAVLGGALAPAPARPAAAVALAADTLAARAGLYLDPETNEILRLTARDGRLRMGAVELTPLSPTRFLVGPGPTELSLRPAAAGRRAEAVLLTADFDTVRYVATDEARPTAAQLAEYAGVYQSDELEASYAVAADSGRLVIRRGTTARPLAPTYADAFEGSGFGDIVFVRDPATGRVTGFLAGGGRVRGVRFVKVR